MQFTKNYISIYPPKVPDYYLVNKKVIIKGIYLTNELKTTETKETRIIQLDNLAVYIKEDENEIKIYFENN